MPWIAPEYATVAFVNVVMRSNVILMPSILMAAECMRVKQQIHFTNCCLWLYTQHHLSLQDMSSWLARPSEVRMKDTSCIYIFPPILFLVYSTYYLMCLLLFIHIPGGLWLEEKALDQGTYKPLFHVLFCWVSPPAMFKFDHEQYSRN
jgi:hypothetical protein